MKSLIAVPKSTSKHRKKGISPILATIILIIITVVVGVMLYGFVTGFFSSSSTSMEANVQAQLTIPAGANYGTFVVTIKNAGTVAITEVSIQLKGPTGNSIASATYSGLNIAPGQSQTFTASGSGSSAWSGSPSSGAYAYLNSTNVISGSSYNYIITIQFANGGVKTYTGSVTASSF